MTARILPFPAKATYPAVDPEKPHVCQIISLAEWRERQTPPDLPPNVTYADFGSNAQTDLRGA